MVFTWTKDIKHIFQVFRTKRVLPYWLLFLEPLQGRASGVTRLRTASVQSEAGAGRDPGGRWADGAASRGPARP